MKITIPTKQLLAAVATLKPICKPSTAYPVLSNVCVTATKDGITLLGMDGEKQLSITLPCKVKERGATTMSCSRLHDSLVDARSADCTIETTEKHETTIRAGTAVSRILGLPVEDMIQQVAVSDGEGIMISATKFNNAMNACFLHSSDEDSKPLFKSVVILSRNGVLNFQASDYKHAVICGTEILFEEEGFFIIPRDSVPAITKLATEGEIALLFGENAMSVKADGIEFRTKLIEGNLPDFETAFPVDRPLKIIVNLGELDAIVKYAEKGTSELAKHIILECDGSKLTARGQGAVKSESSDTFFDINEDSAKCEEGSVIKFKMNPQYIKDVLKCLSVEKVTLEIVNETKPVIIQDGDNRFSICPIKLD